MEFNSHCPHSYLFIMLTSDAHTIGIITAQRVHSADQLNLGQIADFHFSVTLDCKEKCSMHQNSNIHMDKQKKSRFPFLFL